MASLSTRSYFFDSGLQFACRQCGTCCTGVPGIIRVSAHEIDHIAAYLEIPRQQFRREYLVKWRDALSIGEYADGRCRFYDQGCRGPMTHAPCNKIMWNDVSSKTRSGQPCFGCTEPDFPRRHLFETRKNMSIPEEVPLGISKRSYLTLTGIAKTFRIERLHARLTDDH